MKKVINNVRHSWTKDEVKRIVSLWDQKNPDELANDLNISKLQLMYMVGLIRKNGYKLTRKRKNGTLSILIKEALSELK